MPKLLRDPVRLDPDYRQQRYSYIWIAHRLATAMNEDDVILTIDITFTYFVETSELKAEEGNFEYNANPTIFNSPDLAAPTNEDINFS